jgi:RHS repeat-associated protein
MCELFVGNPVNVATGNKYEEAIDITVSISGVPFEFRRSYNSQSTYDGPLGYGWSHTYNIWLEEIEVEDDPMRRVVIRDWDGRGLYFTEIMSEAGSDETPFFGESGVKDRLAQITATGEYLLRRKTGGLTYRFDPEGRLTEIADLNGNQLILSYDRGRLIEVLSNFGRALTFGYRADGLIDSVKDPNGESVYYHYDQGDLTRVTYPDDNSLGYAYSDHNLTNKYDTDSGLIGHWEYDDNHRVTVYYRHEKDGAEQGRIDLGYTFLKTEVIHPSHVTTYGIQVIDGIHVVREIEGCSSCPSVNVRYDYGPRLDLFGLTSIDDEKQVTTAYVYDDPKVPWEQVGLITEKTEAVGWDTERKTRYSYSFDEVEPLLVRKRVEVLESVVSPGDEKTTTWVYDGAGQLITREETGYTLVNGVPTLETHKTEYHYTDCGQLDWIDGPRTDVSDITVFEHYENTEEAGNNRGELKAIINALGQRTEFSDYDANGNVGTITDPNGVVTTHTYDRRNRIQTITNQETGGLTEYLYDTHGNIDAIVLPAGNLIDYGYDPSDRLIEIKDSLGNRIVYTPDTEGNIELEEIFDPHGVLQKTVSMVHDGYNRLESVHHPDGSARHHDYDGKGNLTSVTDENDRLTEYRYDELDRLRQVIEYPGEGPVITEYTYDGHDNLVKVIDARGNTTESLYDDFARLTNTISPDTGKTVYRYDETGNLIEKTDARGTVVSYRYDPLNRLTRVDFPKNRDVMYTYDDPLVSYGVGRLTGILDASGTTVFSYDPLGNITREDKRLRHTIFTTEYRYDQGGNLTGLTYPTGRVVDYTFDRARRISEVTTTRKNRIQTVAQNISYLPFGPVSGLFYGNGLSLRESYDFRYRLGNLEVGEILDLGYDRDGVGNIETITDYLDPQRTQTFRYDDLDRLTGAQGIYGTISYTYDPVGNRKTRVLDGETETYLYGEGTNRLESVTSEHETGLRYDKNGNIRSIGPLRLHYNQNNRLIATRIDKATVGRYTHNALGQRTTKRSREGRIFYHYDLEGHLLAETTKKGVRLVEYLWLGDRLVAVSPRYSSLLFAHTDHLGTPTRLTDRNGLVVWREDHRPFGETTVDQDPDGDAKQVVLNLRLPGQYFDKETGLHYNYFRDYHPGIGRYVEPDPLGFEGGSNLYSYGLGNPINYIDPEGKLVLLLFAPAAYSATAALIDLAIIGCVGWTTHQAILSIERHKTVDCETEKKKLTVGNRPEEIKYGGPWPPKKIHPEPDDECARLASAIRSPSFKNLPWYERYLAYLMFYIGCGASSL